MNTRASLHSKFILNTKCFRIYIAFTIFCFLISPVYSQTQISGVVNSYAKVTSINHTANSVTLTSASSYSIGDKVLLIQMQGATIDASQSSAFGNITAYNNAGNYEIQTICDIQGSTVVFGYDLLNNYDVSGAVQLVRIPVYANAKITGSYLTAEAWNGSTGGVLIIEVLGTLDFGTENINVIGKGFRGANHNAASGNCSWILDNSYYKTMSSADDKASKGEGISIWQSGKECGRGPQANGGGGGNNHNGGGGGGANYGAGGRGGERIKSSTFTCGSYYGLTSKNLVSGYNSDKLFMGGGGGAGHVNNSVHAGEKGTNGSGIVIIKANAINSNNKTIYSYGAIHSGDAINDGGGGGGAGGTVLLDVNSYSGTLNVNVNGANGANTLNTGSSNCNGPGGGGGAGIVMLKNSSMPANVNIYANGGQSGIVASESQNNCSVGNTNNATNGGAGSTTFNLMVKEATVNTAVCSFGPLPIELVYFNASVENNTHVKLEWETQTEINNHYFEIERSFNRLEWTTINKVAGAGNSNTILEYAAYDLTPLSGISYYRLKQVDYNGDYSYSEVEQINFIGIEVINLYPNPSPGIIQLTLNSTENSNAVIQLYHTNGKNVYNRKVELQKGFKQYTLDFNYLSSGIYIFKISIADRNYIYQTKLNLID